MKLIITIDSGNEAVDDSMKVAELVRNVSERLDAGYTNGRIVDYNGHHVGDFSLTETD